ncbi:MAG: hypothetical protein NVS2B7_34160 [Herpetosiphon sp.]
MDLQDQAQVKKRLGGAAIVIGMSVPALCALPVLAFIAPGWVRWVIGLVWLGVVIVAGVVVWRVVPLFKQDDQ